MKKWPVLFLFDAHARGKLAVEKFKDAAENLGYILIASNNSKNGLSLETSALIANNLIGDGEKRIAIDKNRIYACGFSGGARVAAYLAINRNDIKGVIGCGAGFPSQQQQVFRKFDYLGIAGKEDFNLLELQELAQSLENNKFRHLLLTFYGKHDWPPPETVQDAFLWLECKAIKDKLIPQNDTLITEIINSFQSRIKTAKKINNYIDEADCYRMLINYLDGIMDISSYQEELTKLEQNEKYQERQEHENKIFAEEKSEQKRFFDAFVNTTYTIDWWKKEVEQINKRNKKEKDKIKFFADKRLLNYLSLLAYTHSENALNSGQIGYAGRFLEIYYLVDPENPDCSFLWACFHTLKGDSAFAAGDTAASTDEYDKAFGVLQNAIKLGFNDIERLKEEPILQKLKNDNRFDSIVRLL
ncbi:MAG: hypothetical protein HY738_11865 [Bacteroidia bacterium]|nr:hypothetical protein [Bacteroidia bacterium]